jgi:hypothetical protein
VSIVAVGLSCTDQATLTITQAGASFTGSAEQTGQCTLNGAPFDNSGTFEITDGLVRQASITFTEPGEPGCDYEGALTGDAPTGGSGTVSCVGNVSGLGQLNATGTWQIVR